MSALRARVKAAVPRRRQQQLIEARLTVRCRLDPARPLPEFLVIGTQRGGTSSLYKWLEAHPNVVASLRKETEFFSARHDRGLGWYRAHFPSRVRRAAQRAAGRPVRTFEASPYYLQHPLAPERARALVPDARLVVLLRDPVARAVSHHRHMTSLGLEDLPLADALDAEERRLAGVEERLATDPAFVSVEHQRHSYVGRGEYAAQLERWLAHFPREQILVLASEALYGEPDAAYDAVLRHVGLPPFRPKAFANHSRRAGEARDLDPAIAERLRAHFAPHNARLVALLGQEFAWAT